MVKNLPYASSIDPIVVLEDQPNPYFCTICEVLREMYYLAEGQEEIVERIKEATMMAKRMKAKLLKYKHNYDDGWYEAKIGRDNEDSGDTG